MSDKFPGFSNFGKGLKQKNWGRKRPKNKKSGAEQANKNVFKHVGGFWALFSYSLGFFTSIALGFVPKDPLGSDNKPKQNFKKKLENLSGSR